MTSSNEILNQSQNTGQMAGSMSHLGDDDSQSDNRLHLSTELTIPLTSPLTENGRKYSGNLAPLTSYDPSLQKHDPSHPSDTAYLYTGKSALVRDELQRATKVVQYRYQRALQHVSNYMRITVLLDFDDSPLAPVDRTQTNHGSSVTETESSAQMLKAQDSGNKDAQKLASQNNDPREEPASSGKTAIKMTLVMERSCTIENLAKQVEAEYAFLNMEESMGRALDQPDTMITSLFIVAVYDRSRVPLNFQSPLHEVLNTGDSVRIVGVTLGKGQSTKQSDLVAARVRAIERLPEFRNMPMTKWPVELQTNEIKMTWILHNLMSIQHFQDFTMQEFEIENLLFWLEIEVFRGMTFSQDGDQDRYLAPNDPRFNDNIIHIRYIYFSFISSKSPLRLNLPSDLKATVPWPIPRLDAVTGLHRPIDLQMYDEVQEHVFYYMAYYILPRFLTSQTYADLQSTIATRLEEFECCWIEPGDHRVHFYQDVSAMEKALMETVNTNLQQDEPEEDFLQHPPILSLQVHSTAAPFPLPMTRHVQIAAPKQSLLSTTVSSTTLSTLDNPFAAESQGESRTTKSYYGDGYRLTAAQKQRRQHRDMRLKKLLNEKLKEKNNEVTRSTAVSEPTISKPNESFNGSEDTSVVAYSDKFYHKTKKLEEFFGVDKFTIEQAFEQKIVNTIVPDESDDLTTTNNLPIQAKKRLLQQSKKLKDIFGEPAEKHFLNAATNPSIPRSITTTTMSGTEERRSSTMSTDSVSSLVSITERMRRIRMDKTYQRKKLDKIRYFLGERISRTMLETMQSDQPANNLAPVSKHDRQVLLRRVNKLQAILGETPPAEMVTPSNRTSVPDSKQDDTLSPQAQILLQCILSNDSDAEAFVQLMNHFDHELGILEEGNEELGESEEQVPSVPVFQAHPEQRRAMARKRIGKLTKFFGTPVGMISSEIVNEDALLMDLGRHLKDVIEPELLHQLARERVQRRERLESEKMSETVLYKPQQNEKTRRRKKKSANTGKYTGVESATSPNTPSEKATSPTVGKKSVESNITRTSIASNASESFKKPC